MKTAVDVKVNIKKIVQDVGLKHVAIIMDGNRRWAKEKNLASMIGHKKGAEALKTTLKSCHSFGIEYLTVYAFSTENWNRDRSEVDFLMGLLAQTIKSELKEMHQNDVRIRFIGDISPLNNGLKEILQNAESITKDNQGVKLQIAFNYGSRDEIVKAVQRIIAQGISPDNITEDLISKNLYTRDIPDPDLLIRTGGEMRISNYLLWQSAYSEILVLEQFWPDFDEESLENAVLEFQNRNRRFGK